MLPISHTRRLDPQLQRCLSEKRWWSPRRAWSLSFPLWLTDLMLCVSLWASVCPVSLHTYNSFRFDKLAKKPALLRTDYYKLQARNLYFTNYWDWIMSLALSNLPTYLLPLLAGLDSPQTPSILTYPFSLSVELWRIKATRRQQLSRVPERLKAEAKPTETIMREKTTQVKRF